MQTIEQQLNVSQLRRMTNEARFLDRISAREDAADAMIGTLNRIGKEVFYVWPVGGKYMEDTRFKLIAFLLRNNYA